MVDIERVKGKAEQLKGEVEQAVGRATGSMETQARGMVDEAKGKALGAIADFKGEAKREAGEAQEQLAEISGKAKSTLTGLSLTSIVVAVVGALVVLALVAAWRFRAARQPNASGGNGWWNPAP